MNRLELSIEELTLGQNCSFDEPSNEDFVLVEEEQISYDGEKGFVDFRLVYLRESDNKFFETEYTQFGHNGGEFTKDLKEVFVKTKTIEYYE